MHIFDALKDIGIRWNIVGTCRISTERNIIILSGIWECLGMAWIIVESLTQFDIIDALKRMGMHVRARIMPTRHENYQAC